MEDGSEVVGRKGNRLLGEWWAAAQTNGLIGVGHQGKGNEGGRRLT